MNDFTSTGTYIAVSVYVCHDVVAEPLFIPSSRLEVDLVHASTQFGQLFLRDRQP